MKDLETLNAVYNAAEKLVRCKGRYHAELNYKNLANLFGVNLPYLRLHEELIEAQLKSLHTYLVGEELDDWANTLACLIGVDSNGTDYHK